MRKTILATAMTAICATANAEYQMPPCTQYSQYVTYAGDGTGLISHPESRQVYGPNWNCMGTTNEYYIHVNASGRKQTRMLFDIRCNDWYGEYPGELHLAGWARVIQGDNEQSCKITRGRIYDANNPEGEQRHLEGGYFHTRRMKIDVEPDIASASPLRFKMDQIELRDLNF